jgi:oxygen-independent coproporphyrinogen III oxidase
MAGIYIHIPFCKQACHYCDFHFSTNLKSKSDLINALWIEMEQRKNYLKNEIVETIYLGGGTPSILNERELNQIFEHLNSYFEISKNAEITLEANPDDISKEKLSLFKTVGINRLSIGIQSFYQPFLQWMNRVHSDQEAFNSVRLAQDAGFDNISIDLIYGIPAIDHSFWINDIEKAIDLNISHISAYHLTIEPRTKFGKMKEKKVLNEAEEAFSLAQFEILIDKLAQNDFQQYEISNFAKNGNVSRHNSSYWKGVNYLGIGPSAHSFNGISRQYNVSNNARYIEGILANNALITEEILSEIDKANEYIMLGLRTSWGVDLNVLYAYPNLSVSSFHSTLEKYIQLDCILKTKNNIVLTSKGKFIADRIISDLFFS